MSEAKIIKADIHLSPAEVEEAQTSNKPLAELTFELLKKLTVDFAAHRGEWALHREEAKIAMKRIESLQSDMSTIQQNVTHLPKLTEISQTLLVMKEGIVSQNANLIGQNSQLIAPGTKAQNMLSNIVIFILLVLGAAVLIILIRDSRKDLSIGGEKGIHITENDRGQQTKN